MSFSPDDSASGVLAPSSSLLRTPATTAVFSEQAEEEMDVDFASQAPEELLDGTLCSMKRHKIPRIVVRPPLLLSVSVDHDDDEVSTGDSGDGSSALLSPMSSALRARRLAKFDVGQSDSATEVEDSSDSSPMGSFLLSRKRFSSQSPTRERCIRGMSPAEDAKEEVSSLPPSIPTFFS